jgi:hypothetical protein
MHKSTTRKVSRPPSSALHNQCMIWHNTILDNFLLATFVHHVCWTHGLVRKLFEKTKVTSWGTDERNGFLNTFLTRPWNRHPWRSIVASSQITRVLACHNMHCLIYAEVGRQSFRVAAVDQQFDPTRFWLSQRDLTVTKTFHTRPKQL